MDYQEVENSFHEGKIETADAETLRKYLLILSNASIPNDRVRHRDIIRGLTINHILLQRHIQRLDDKNSVLQWVVVVLAVASLIGTAAQVWLALPH